MVQFVANLRSPSWWLSVVVVGILLNVIANYLTRGIDLASSRLSSRWLSWWRSPKLKPESREQMVARLSTNEVARALTSVEAASAPWWGAGMICFAVSAFMKAVSELAKPDFGHDHRILEVFLIALLALSSMGIFLSGLGYLVKARYLAEGSPGRGRA